MRETTAANNCSNIYKISRMASEITEKIQSVVKNHAVVLERSEAPVPREKHARLFR